MLDVALSPDGKRLAVSSAPAFGEPGGVNVWELEYGRGIQTLRGLAGQVSKVHFSPDGRFLAALASNWRIAIWNVLSGRLLHVLEGPVGEFADNAALAFNTDASHFAFATGREARLW